MKHRALSILLALTFLLSVFMFCTTAFAATGAQDGVSAELTTDKTDYVAGESIDVTLVVKNENVRVNNVRTELVIPAGVTLTTGALVSDGVDLAPNSEATYNYGLTVDVPEVPTTEAPTTNAPTTNAPTTPGEGGDDGAPETRDISMMIYGVLAVASLAGLVALVGIKNIAKQRWFVLVLCGALLLGAIGPVAANAATEKTFEVTEAITLDGAAAEVKAIITYDLNDEVVHTEEVVFKQGGEYLWNVDVEQGYYLPSDIKYDGKTTSKDGAYRPEVNAPYIDMLFGTAKKAGEFTVDIFNETAQQTALIGLTDDAASKAALEMIDEDEWIIALIDGKLVVTGWYDNATAAAARALYALGSADAADITLNLPMIGKMDYVDVELPEVTFGNFRGGMDSDFGAIVLRWNEVVADDFDTYCATLEAAGYTMIESNTMAGYKNTKTLEFATYVKGTDAILVQYLPVSLLDQDPANLNAVELKAYQAAYSADGDAIRLILTSTDLLGNTAEENTGWTDLGITPKMHNVNLYNKQGDGNDIGQAEIFTLADGSYIVVDGGQGADAEQLYRTLYYMNERPDGKIVIAAWFLTHAHGDHTGALGSLAASEWADEITIEQMILNPVAKSYRWRTEYDPYGYAAGMSIEFDNIRTVTAKFAQGEDYQLVLPHMGQIMHIRNAEVEMLTVGDEDMFPVIFNNDNAQSLAFRVTFPGVTIDGADQSVMILGDSALDQTYNVYFPLMCGELYADILQVSHHGLGGQTSRFYPMFSGIEVSIFPTTWRTINTHGLIYSSGTNKGLQPENGGTTKLNIVCDEYVQTLELPFDVENDHVLRTKIGTYKTKFQDAEMEISMLPAYRFQKQWNNAEAQEKIISYLKEYSADLLILPLIDQNSAAYNNADLVNALYEYLDYNYVYYAPVWDTTKDATGNFENGDNTMGHLILSTYPVLKAETGILVEGNTTAWANPEGRGYAHLLLDVEGVEMDVVATHFNDAGNWTKFAELYEQWGKYTIIAGNTKIKGDGSKVGEGVSSAFAEDITILGSEGISFVDSKTDTRLNTEGDAYFVNKNMSKIYTTKAVFSLYTPPEETYVPVRQAFANWWVNSWGNNYADFEKVVKTLKEVNPAIAAFHMVNHEVIGMTEEQVKAELGYPYAIWVPNSANSAGQWSGHYLVSHYPIEDLGVLEVTNGSDDAADQYKTPRVFGHALVTINGTEIDIWYGSVGPNAPKQVANLEAAVAATATETGRPFIVSTNDASSLATVTSFAGYEVYNYCTDYMANVLVSKGKVTVTGTELVDSGVSWAGVDKMNVLDLDVRATNETTSMNAGAWYQHTYTAANKDQAHATLVMMDKDMVVFCNYDSTVASPEEVAAATGYAYYHYTPFDVNATSGRGTLLLSKLPLTLTGHTIDVSVSSPYSYGRVQITLGGKTVNVYYGQTQDGDSNRPYSTKVLAEAIEKQYQQDGLDFIALGIVPDKDGVFSVKDAEGNAVSTTWNGYDGYGYVLVSDAFEPLTNTDCRTHYNDLKAMLLENGYPAVDYPKYTGDFVSALVALKSGDSEEPPVTPEPEPEPEPEPDEPAGETVTLNVAVVPVSRFGSKFTANKDVIIAAIKSVNVDVLAITQIDENVSNPSWWNNTNVATQIIEGVKDVYPYAYFAPAWYTVAGEDGAHGHLILSKYEIKEYETVVLVEGTPYQTGYTEGRAAGRVLLDVKGVSVDVFFMHTGAASNWDVLAPAILESKADAWVAMGYMNYAGIEKSGIEAKLGTEINAAFDLKYEGAWNYINIISGTNAAISNVVRETTTFGSFGADPLSAATITFAKPEITAPESVELNVAVVPVSRFGSKFTANKDAIIAAIKSVNVDVLAITQIDENVSNPSWWNNTNVATQIIEGVKDVYPYAYFAPAWYTVAGEDGAHGHLILSKYEIKEYETIVLVEGTPYQTGYTEGRAAGRVLLDVKGVSVDVFFMHTGSAANWDVLAPAILASKADAWVAMGYMNYAGIEKSGIEEKLGTEINAAFDLKYEGAWNYINIISGTNAAISNVVRETTTFGSFGADPLSSATVLVTP